MRVVYVPGVWDLLHVGHLAILERASRLGDSLIVGVASDEVAELDKRRRPVIPLADRVRMLEALACVSAAMPYHELRFIGHLEDISPDVLVVGADWGDEPRHREAERWAKENGCRVVKLPRHRGESSSEIRARVGGKVT